MTADLVTGIDSFLWVGPNGFVSHSQNPYIPNVSAANAGVYSLYLIDNGCSGPAVTTTVTIFPALSVYAGADTIIWCGTFATLTATVTGGSGSFLYDWSPNVLLTNPHEQNTSTISLNCSVLFIVTVTDSITQCKNTDTVCVIMYCSPPTLFVSAQPDTICTGDSVTLDVTNGCYQPYSYTWSSTPGNFHSTLSNFIVNPVVTTTYTVTATDGFYTNTSSVVVTVTSSLMEYLISSDTMCLSGTTTTISTNGSDTGVYYILYKNGVVLGPPLAGTGSALSWDMLSSGVYYMEAYDSTGLPCGNYFSNTLVIGHHPLVVLGNDTTVCNVFTLTLVGPPGLGYSYTWLRLPDDTLGQSQYLYLDYSTSGLGQYYYTLHVSDSNQCFGADTIGVNFQICPSVHEYGAHFTEVFPNPASTYIEIKTEINHITDIEIINMQGVVVLISPLSSKIDISHLSPGFYILRFSDGTRQYHKKFVKNRF
ncbi:MAG: hypothetical protein BWY70_01209 [Bacteroidetes bacterium ADurb.Bin408]|nr:MAG: hypothetical protein BWY70_01209 [Bacteroidetes bacterium ADurb.Bin408]